LGAGGEPAPLLAAQTRGGMRRRRGGRGSAGSLKDIEWPASAVYNLTCLDHILYLP